mgnify:CR=1 FL=1
MTRVVQLLRANQVQNREQYSMDLGDVITIMVCMLNVSACVIAGVSVYRAGQYFVVGMMSATAACNLVVIADTLSMFAEYSGMQ